MASILTFYGGDIVDGSAGTPGLWDRRFSTISQNLDEVNIAGIALSAASFLGTEHQISIDSSGNTVTWSLPSGLTTPGDTQIGGTLHVDSALSVDSTLTVAGAVLVRGDIDISKATPAVAFTDSGTPRNWNMGVNGTSGFFFITDLTGATTRYNITTAGVHEVTGNIGVNNATPETTSGLHIGPDLTTDFGRRLRVRETTTSASGTVQAARLEIQTVTATTGSLFGLESHARIANASGTVVNTAGLRGLGDMAGAGTVTTLRGIEGQALQSAGTVTNLIAILATVSQGGTTTNAIGLDVANVSGATNNFAIRTGTGIVSLGDDLLLGTDSAPSTSTPKLDILESGAASVVIASALGNSVVKTGAYTLRHFTEAEEEIVLIRGSTTGSESRVVVGGGSGVLNAATAIHFNTATAITGLGGSLRWQIPSTGHLTPGATNTYDVGDSVIRVRSLFLSGSVDVSGTGPHVVGTAPIDFNQFHIGGAFTSGGAGTTAAGFRVNTLLTGASGDTGFLAVTAITGTVTTNDAGVTAVVASLYLEEPTIVVGGGGSVTNSATLYIEAAATEATNDYALFVDAGVSRFDANVGIDNTAPDTTNGLHIGPALDVDLGSRFRARETTTSASGTVQTGRLEMQSVTATTGSLYALDCVVTAANTTGTIVNLFGAKGLAQLTAAGTVTTIRGVHAQAGQSDGTVTDLIALQATVSQGGTTTNAIGVDVPNVSGATNNFAIRTGTGVSDFGGLVQTIATAAGSAGLNVPHGTAPSSPVNGDMWTTTAGLFVRINGSTVGPLT